MTEEDSMATATTTTRRTGADAGSTAGALALALSHPSVAGRRAQPLDQPMADVIDLVPHLAEREAAAARARGRVYLRRRLTVVAGFLAFVLALALLLGGRGADANVELPPVAGHAVVEPGMSLWEIAQDHAPAGSDPRAYLDQLIDLNDLSSGSVPAWTVVLLPAAPAGE